MFGWIPQAYYDFLARVVPGSAIVLGAYYLEEGPTRGIHFVLRSLCEPADTWVSRFAVGLLAAYLTGLVLGELGELIAGRVLERRDDEVGVGLRRECLDEHNDAMKVAGWEPVVMLADDLPDMAVMGEQLALVDHYNGSRLLALRAERRLCLVLVFGILMLLLGNLMAFTVDFVATRLVIEGVLIVALFVFWRRSTRLHERAVRRTCLGWLMSVAKGGSQGTAS